MSTPGRMGLARLRMYANDRDLAVLRSIQKFRFLSTRHICELHFATHASYVSGIRACTRVLSRLESHGFISRLPRPVGGSGGGSTSTIWSLGPAGARLLQSGESHGRKKTSRARAYEPTIAFLAHTLAIADLRVALEHQVREGVLELLEVHTEPQNWRTFPGPSGRTRTLKPDLSTVLAVGDDEFFQYWEIDLATEPIHRLIDQCLIYQQYYDSGAEQAETGVFPLVVWLLADSRRRSRLQEAIARNPALRDDIFFVASPDDLGPVLFGSDPNPN